MVCLTRLRPLQLPALWKLLLGSGVLLGLELGASLGAGTVALGQTPSPTAPAPSATPTISGDRILRPTLRLGSQGESVKELQAMLMLLGYYPGPVSGVYQEDTQQAVQSFQRAAGITTDGIVGPATWSQLFPTPLAEANPPATAGGSASRPTPSQPNPTPTGSANSTASRPTPGSSTMPANLPVLRPGMEGDAVRQLQQRLQAKGVYRGPIDGIFGSQTEAAVRQIQQTNRLTVDGIVGPATWRVLY